MKVRTGDPHGFPQEEATTLEYVVDPTPTLDKARKALLEAQDRYFSLWPNARKHAKAYLWDIEPEISDAIREASDRYIVRTDVASRGRDIERISCEKYGCHWSMTGEPSDLVNAGYAHVSKHLE